MHSSNYLNEADMLLYLHLVFLRILAKNLTSLYVNAVVVVGVVDVGHVVVVVAIAGMVLGTPSPLLAMFIYPVLYLI